MDAFKDREAGHLNLYFNDRSRNNLNEELWNEKCVHLKVLEIMLNTNHSMLQLKISLSGLSQEVKKPLSRVT